MRKPTQTRQRALTAPRASVPPLLPVPRLSPNLQAPEPEGIPLPPEVMALSSPNPEESLLDILTREAAQEQQQGVNPVNVPYPTLQRNLPPPILPPVYDRAGEQEQSRKALQLAGLLPLLGQLTGGGDIGSLLLPQALATSLGGIRERETQEYARASDLFDNQRQVRADQVQAIDFANDLARQEWSDRYSVDREEQNRLESLRRENRLTRREEALRLDSERKASQAEEKAKQTAIKNISTTLERFPNDPEMVYRLHGNDIQRHNIELERDENGNLVPVTPLRLTLQREREAGQDRRQAQRFDYQKELEQIRSGNRQAEIRVRHIGQKEIQEMISKRQINLADVNNIVRLKIAADRNEIDRTRNANSLRIAQMRQSGVPTGDKALKEISALDSKISSLRKSIAQQAARLKPKTYKRSAAEGGEIVTVEADEQTINQAMEATHVMLEEIRRIESLRQIILDNAGLNLQGGRYIRRTGAVNMNSGSVWPGRKDPNVNTSGMTPVARQSLGRVYGNLSDLFPDIKLNDAAGRNYGAHGRGVAADIGLSTNRTPERFRQLAAEIGRIPGVKSATYEAAGQVNRDRNGKVISRASGPHVHVVFEAGPSLVGPSQALATVTPSLSPPRAATPRRTAPSGNRPLAKMSNDELFRIMAGG